MAKSQSESSLHGAFLLVIARHHSHCHCEKPKATKQCQYIRGGEEKKAWPGQKSLFFVIARSAATTQSLYPGQPEMRQA